MATARVWLSGFLLLGILLGLLGSLVVAWHYYIDVEPQLIGLHFLCLNAGYVMAAAGAQKLLHRISAKTLAVGACAIACGSLTALFFVAPPVAAAWRLGALAVMGLGAGGLGTALLYACEPYFEEQPAAAVNRAGILFGSGCLLATIIVGTTFYFGLFQLETALLAIFPLVFFLTYAATANSALQGRALEQERLRETLRDLRSVATVLFSLLLFVQFGNEWAIAGWLPLFLIHRLGANPGLAIGVLAIYFLALMLGRVLAQRLLPRLNQRKFLVSSIAAAMCGFLLLSLSWSLAIATLAVVIVGLGFAPIYPLIAGRLDHRFSYHPGFYNGTISIAITGAMSAPWLLGFVDASLGMSYVMLLPALGSIVVLILSLLLMFEAHLMHDAAAIRTRSAKAGSGS